MTTREELGPRELGLTSTPRQTWVWAADAEQCAEVRAVIDGAGGLATWRQATRYGMDVEHVSDIDIGVDALESKEALKAAGFTLVRIEDPDRAPTWY
ncbi:hypothetical protein [Demequina sp.]|uniref:hypothetical protein n=1 Tax=Demequina sp. TaxID=2050685 RepID=UPI003D10F489